VLLVAAVLTLTRLRGLARTVSLVPVLWLAAFVWESRLAAEPSVTRQLLLGAILVVMMNARPQGLLGRPRVEAL
jgi:ABC-type branched-subunit amino acid transport system permease subunit